MWSHNAFIYCIINTLINIPNAICNHKLSLTEFFRFASFFLAFNSQGSLPHPGPIPACSDIVIIALSLFQSLLSIESECRFFSTLRFLLPGFSVKLSRRNFNSRCRRLTQFIEIIWKRLSLFLCANTGDSLLIIDSMPIETCRYFRASSSRIFRTVPPHMLNSNCIWDTS